MLMALSTASAQSKAAPLSFEAASVKSSAPPVDGRIMRQMNGGPGSRDPGMLTYSNVTLKEMLVEAYDLKPYQVEVPDWADNLGYDVVAKMAQGTTMEQMRRMLQTLLAERFKVAIHRETKQLPVYALTVAKGGPKMKVVEPPDPNAAPAEGPPAGRRGPPPGDGAFPADGRGGRAGAPPPMPKGPGVRMRMTPTGRELAGYMTMSDLANALSNSMGRAVVDQTELTATYDVDVTWTPDELDRNRMGAMAGPPAGGAAGGEAPRTASEPGLSLPQALQETLGLKLDPRKSAAEVLIMDHADKVPVEN